MQICPNCTTLTFFARVAIKMDLNAVQARTVSSHVSETNLKAARAIETLPTVTTFVLRRYRYTATGALRTRGTTWVSTIPVGVWLFVI
jgi:hypothetical protein